MKLLAFKGLMEKLGQAPDVDVDSVYRQYRIEIFNYFRRWGLQPQISEELTQGVFVVLLENLHRYEPARGALKPFLFGIARNLRWAWQRKSRREVPEKGWKRQSNTRISPAQESEIVREAVQSLPGDQREALILREFHGFSYEEIAIIQKVPRGTIRSRLARARHHLREKLRMK